MGLFSSIGKIAGGILGGGNPIAAAVGGGIGGLLDGKPKAQTTTSRINFQQMRDDAVAAGYNPLTALMATQGAGNVTTTAPSLSSNEFLGSLLEGGVDTYYNQKQQQRDIEFDNLKLATMKAELESVQLRNAAPLGGGYFGHTIPTYSSSGPSANGMTAEKIKPSYARNGDKVAGATDDATDFETDVNAAGKNGVAPSHLEQLFKTNVPDFVNVWNRNVGNLDSYSAKVAKTDGGLLGRMGWNPFHPSWNQ